MHSYIIILTTITSVLCVIPKPCYVHTLSTKGVSSSPPLTTGNQFPLVTQPFPPNPACYLLTRLCHIYYSIYCCNLLLLGRETRRDSRLFLMKANRRLPPHTSCNQFLFSSQNCITIYTLDSIPYACLYAAALC